MARRALFILFLSAALLGVLSLWLASCGGATGRGGPWATRPDGDAPLSVGDAHGSGGDSPPSLGDGSSPLPSALLARTGSGSLPPWSMFGKNSLRTRRSEHTGPPTNRLKWKYATTGDVFYSSPAIAADGTIYIGDQGDGAKNPKLYAITSSGRLKWAFETFGGLNSPALSADGSTIYVGGGYKRDRNGRDTGIYDTKLYALSSSGSLRWTYTTGGVVENAPAIGSDGTVYFGSLDGKLYALNPDGTPKAGSWPFGTGDLGRINNSSPAIGNDGTLYIGTYRLSDSGGTATGNFYAVNPDGTEKWHYYFADGIFFSSAAVGMDGTVYIGAVSSTAEHLGDCVLAFNPGDGSVKWTYPTNGQVFSSPAIGTDGAVYVGCSYRPEANGGLYALNSDGTLRWMLDVGAASVRSSPALGADGTVYAAASDSSGTATTFYAVSPNGTVKWSYALPPAYSYSSPAIGADGTVYTGANGPYGGATRHGLFAFGPGIN